MGNALRNGGRKNKKKKKAKKEGFTYRYIRHELKI